jgi:hypothetical protein
MLPRLRPFIEKHYSLEPGERQLSAEARTLAFHGAYFFYPSRIRSYERFHNPYANNNNFALKRRLSIHRTLGGIRPLKGKNHNSYHYMDEPNDGAIIELNKPESITRINRVEKIAKKWKSIGILAGVVVIGTPIAITEALPIESPIVQTCTDFTRDSIPHKQINPNRIVAALDRGEFVCKHSGLDYVVPEHNEQS